MTKYKNWELENIIQLRATIPASYPTHPSHPKSEWGPLASHLTLTHATCETTDGTLMPSVCMMSKWVQSPHTLQESSECAEQKQITKWQSVHESTSCPRNDNS